jgi:hypothetical protein
MIIHFPASAISFFKFGGYPYKGGPNLKKDLRLNRENGFYYFSVVINLKAIEYISKDRE